MIMIRLNLSGARDKMNAAQACVYGVRDDTMIRFSCVPGALVPMVRLSMSEVRDIIIMRIV